MLRLKRERPLDKYCDYDFILIASCIRANKDWIWIRMAMDGINIIRITFYS